MATAADVLLDAFSRVRETVHAALDQVPEDRLADPPAPGANTIAWLVWHLTRILDDHTAGAFDREQVWTDGGWFDRFALPFPPDAHGYGHTYDEVLTVRVGRDDLLGYHDAVQASVREILGAVTDDELDRVVDDSWDPPVTLAVRLVSVANDIGQHAGQVGYAAGILSRA